MSKRLLCFVCVAGLGAAVLLGYLWLTTPEYNVTREVFQLIERGQSKAEVTKLLKRPGIKPIERTKIFDAEYTDPPQRLILSFQEWSHEGAAIMVGFDDEDKVQVGVFCRFEETLWDKIKRWARLR